MAEFITPDAVRTGHCTSLGQLSGAIPRLTVRFLARMAAESARYLLRDEPVWKVTSGLPAPAGPLARPCSSQRTPGSPGRSDHGDPLGSPPSLRPSCRVCV